MRVANWDIKLAEYVDSLRDHPFVWGEHDCLTFANNCVEVVTGRAFADDWLGNYSSDRSALKEYRRVIAGLDHDDFIDCMDERLDRFEGRFPPRGSLVGKPCEARLGVLPVVLGVVVSDMAAFINTDGMVMLPLDESDIFWSVD